MILVASSTRHASIMGISSAGSSLGDSRFHGWLRSIQIDRIVDDSIVDGILIKICVIPVETPLPDVPCQIE
tara:strand:- start:98 stop:310 length:213 start_codon:yes stop_codon:yes gene_type:complete